MIWEDRIILLPLTTYMPSRDWKITSVEITIKFLTREMFWVRHFVVTHNIVDALANTCGGVRP